MIRIFLVKPMPYTPFGGFNPIDIPYLESHDIKIVKNIKEADVLIGGHRKFLKPFFRKYVRKKKYLIWTQEPRFDVSFRPYRKELFGLVRCHIMNLYTEDVFKSPLSFHAQLIQEELEVLPEDFTLPNRQIVGLMSYFKGEKTAAVYKNGEDIDLIKTRTEIALAGQKEEAFHVYGRGWPEGVSKEDSRSGDWVTRKKDLLENYYFNLCFENTSTKYYVTEKIWDSIANYCLPIYYGKHNGIYELFPENSFIDYSTFNHPKEVFSFVKNLSDADYRDRMNACIKVYQSIKEKGKSFAEREREKSLEAIVNKLKMITN
ncbi:glycosyltransferase family 10 [uncultured Dokdonia sp.]|uniref:glycosyltransferase family 10 domain-containing protein n=1 Tax=uncultured Dokdonia sp. TaxID=575653 RepID=UPI00263A0107|nr:glycosyltransferase family 10 [uncultured Dokdonia sp.]